MTTGTGTAITDPISEELWAFVEKARAAFATIAADSAASWQNDTRLPVVSGIKIRRASVSDEDRIFTVGEVTQPAGVVIPPHRHHESHVLLKVIAGSIQVDCEGFSRKVDEGEECLIPQGFSHTVFALTSKSCDSTYWSAHYETFLSVDDNRFLSDWPKDGEHIKELDVVRRLITWFLSLYPTYLKTNSSYRCWFYILHKDPDSKRPDVDEAGFAGHWTQHGQSMCAVRDLTGGVEAFRLGKVLSDSAWTKAKLYSALFVACRDKIKANTISEFYAFWCQTTSKWILEHNNASISTFLKQHEGSFQAYMMLLTEKFLNGADPSERYVVYFTPPQCPGQIGSLDAVQRVPFSSLIVGFSSLTAETAHCPKDFISALQSFFLLCSSILQQMRFAVRADLVEIRYNEERRRAFFEGEFLDSLRPKSGSP